MRAAPVAPEGALILIYSRFADYIWEILFSWYAGAITERPLADNHLMNMIRCGIKTGLALLPALLLVLLLKAIL